MAFDEQTQLSLIQGMLSEPGEEAPRLVYADWLEDRGDPLGELVRLQVEMARPWAARPRLRTLDRRERQLLDGLGLGRAVSSRLARDDRSGNLPGGASFSVIDGLPHLCLVGARAPLPPTAWVERLGWFTARVGFYDSYKSRYEVHEAMLRRLLDWPGMDRCVGLDMGEVRRFYGECDRMLAEWPGGDRLLRLGWFGSVALASPRLADLLDVDLREHRVSEGTVASLAAMQRLCRLRISESGFAPRAVAGLARLSTLRSLDLSDNHLDDAAAHALADGSLHELTHLDLSGSPITDTGALALLRSPNLPRLRRLNLARTRIGTATVEELCRTERLLRCGELALEGCQHITDDALVALARSPHAAHLRSLAASPNLTDAAALAIARSPHLQGLVKLFLASRRLGPDAAVALVGSLPRLKELSLPASAIGDRGALALAALGHAHRDHFLDLSDIGMTACGVAALIASGHLAGVEELWLDDNPISDAGVTALAACPDLAGLRSLWLSDVGMTDAGARALLDSPHLPRGIQVITTGNDFSDQGAALRERFRRGTL